LDIILLIFSTTDWLEDKESANGFALAGIYRPASLIPLEIWKASPNTTNGNEQSHRNIYRDGTKLTLLAGCLRGKQYDYRHLVSKRLLDEHDIHTRDRLPTYYGRARRAIVRSGMCIIHYILNTSFISLN